jgi:multidrug efflux pump subunit AcrB
VNFSAWAIKRPLPALMIFFVLCVAGLWGFHKLPVARFPDVAFPMVTVAVSLPGASPSQLETEVTRKVEDSVATITGVKRVTSNVSEGLSSTAIEFVLDTDLSTALDDVRDAVTRVRADLPQDIQEPVVAKVEIGGSLMTYTVGSRKRTTAELSWLVDRDVS